MAINKIALSAVFSFVIAAVLVSYSEKKQVDFFMPLRTLLFVPQQQVESVLPAHLPSGMPFKASEDGYYINPWQASNVVSKTAVSVLRKGCVSLVAEERTRLLEFAGFFAETAQMREYNSFEFAVWPYQISFTYGLRPGWISGMAQGKVAVVLAAASLCQTNSSFERMARMAINSFEVPVEDGGVLVNLNEGYWYEEYAQAGITPPLVLNGHIYATLALKELQEFDKSSQKLYAKGVAALLGNINHFDAITWTYYDRRGNPANNIYQQPLHARQMLELYEATGDEVFLYYHRKFFAQLFSPFSSVQRQVMNPSRFLGFLIFVNWVFVFALVMFFLYARKIGRHKQ